MAKIPAPSSFRPLTADALSSATDRVGWNVTGTLSVASDLGAIGEPLAVPFARLVALDAFEAFIGSVETEHRDLGVITLGMRSDVEWFQAFGAGARVRGRRLA